MNIDTLKQRLDNANNKLTKLEAKLDRINIALAGGKNPYYYNEYDLKSTTREIDETKSKINELTTALNIEINKENAPKIQVLVEFLEGWRQRADEFYRSQATLFSKEYKEYREELEKLHDRYYKTDEISYDEYKLLDRTLRKSWEKNSARFDKVAVSLSIWKEPYVDEVGLNKILDREVKRKYEDLVNRVTKVVGEIKDCSNLKVGNNGSINGIVVGSDDMAYVETILAGGYNIQCLHYRVLVNKIKEVN